MAEVDENATFATLLVAQMECFESIQRSFKAFTDTKDPPVNKAQVHLQYIQTNWVMCRKLHMRLLATASKADLENAYFKDKEFASREMAYLDIVSVLQGAISATKVSTPKKDASSEFVLPSLHVASSSSSLPRIELPHFSGEYDRWESFRDYFHSIVISDERLDNMRRLHYLKSSLSGEPLNLIDHLSMTESNFTVAWDALTAQYTNNCRIKENLLKSLFSLPSLTRESAADLRDLHSKVTSILGALKSNGEPVQHWSSFLVYFLVQKLDPATRKAWSLSIGSEREYPSFDSFKEFVLNRATGLNAFCPEKQMESKNAGSNSSNKKQQQSQKNQNKSSGHLTSHNVNVQNTQSRKCFICSESHSIYQCPRFKEFTVAQRFEAVKSKNLCINCLGLHKVAQCTSKFVCTHCKQQHHTMLHRPRGSDDQSASEPTQNKNRSSSFKSPPSGDDKSSSSVIINYSSPAQHSDVLLATATVVVHAENGRSVKVRALLDQGSTWTLISEALASSLNAPKIRTSTAVSGVGGLSAGLVKSAASIAISPVKSSVPMLHTNALILKNLTSYTPSTRCPLSQWPHLNHLTLADSDPCSSLPIEILIGADLYGAIILEGLVKGNPEEPIAQNTIFGWVLSGWALPSSGTVPSSASTNFITAIENDESIRCRVDELLEQFWKIEELPKETTPSDDDAYCEEHFLRTHTRDSDGRYTVRLPFKVDPPPIGNTLDIATKCFLSLEKRLLKNPDEHKLYREIIEDYMAQGHMTVVDPDSPPGRVVVRLPHHGVKKDTSTTTKLRVVINASCPSTNGASLNDCLHVGPKLQADIVSVLLQWRLPPYVFSADIAQMYLQVRVAEEDRDAQRIVWRSNPDDPLLEYRLNSVIFGVKCAPYLALRVLQQLCQDDGHAYPLAAAILKQGLYVDDCLFGANDHDTIEQMRLQLVELLKRGGFNLRKWASNDPVLLAPIDPSNHGLAIEKPLREDEGIKLLGLFWNPSTDTFQFHIFLIDIPTPTKRCLLSAIARIYDPLGLVSPIVVIAKILLQGLWLLKLEWDTPLGDREVKIWSSFYNSLPRLSSASFPRWLHVDSSTTSCELHGYCDASKKAYAAVIYLRSTSRDGSVATCLLMSKTRVAPTKQTSALSSTPDLTIPRLELCGALLLAETLAYLKSLPSFAHMPVTYWTDATIVLSWLRKPPPSQVFINNKIRKILNLTKLNEWRHVPTAQNPADLASRGMPVNKFLDSQLWFVGPSWLRENPSNWPTSETVHDDTAVANLVALSDAVPASSACHPCVPPPNDTLENLASRFSDWDRLLRVTAFLLRWVPRARRRAFALIPGAVELERAEHVWFRWIQAQVLSDELELVKNNRPLPKKNPLIGLSPFIDGSGLLRACGRLTHANLDYAAKYPIILKVHPLIRLLVEYVHLRTLHGNLSKVLRQLRDRVWIIQGKKVIKSVIFNCPTCARIKAARATQLMGSLPPPRVLRPEFPFEHTGVDYAGPITARVGDGRGYKSHPAYIALFVCFAVKAIHLEPVQDYSSQAFIDAYKCFVSRRGLPSDMYSDCGTTFAGADSMLRRAYDDAVSSPKMQTLLAKDGVRWHFIPPAAPHFGGLWEAGVKSVKYHLKRILKDRTPSFNELRILLCEIEACLNSRPLAPATNSIDDLAVLTPGHFLIGRSPRAVPAPSLLDFSATSLSRWQQYRQLLESYWAAWSSDHIRSLQQRSKWRLPQEDVKVGQIVLMVEPNYPPTKWPLARVIQCFPGEDGHVRAVELRTEKSTYLRPIAKIALLPGIDIITPHLT